MLQLKGMREKDIRKGVHRKPAKQSRIFVNLNFVQYVPLHTNSGRSLVFDIKGIKKRKVGINQMIKRTFSSLCGFIFLLLFGTFAQTAIATDGYLGMSMPGSWRPFADNSPWNTPIPSNANVHPDSGSIINTVLYSLSISGGGNHLRFSTKYCPPMHVVNSSLEIETHKYISTSIIYSYPQSNIYCRSHTVPSFNPDGNANNITDVKYPYDPIRTWSEPTADAHLIIVDLKDSQNPIAVEGTHCYGLDSNGRATCTTFNIWGLTGYGIVSYPPDPDNWKVAGGRGSGVPAIGGLIRPEEVELAASQQNGKINHALAFSFDFNRCGPPMYPFAYRNDGTHVGNQYPVEGMLFRLDPTFNVDTLPDVYSKILARTLQTYGAVLVDNGGQGMAFYIQRLVPGDALSCNDSTSNCYAWNSRIPGFITSIYNIPADRLQVVNTSYLGSSYYDGHVEPELCQQ